MSKEVREQPCCMCPSSFDKKIIICDGVREHMGQQTSKCNFVVRFKDHRGWEYFVRCGIGSDAFKTFYVKPGASLNGKGLDTLPYRTRFSDAQTDLNRYAKEKGWEVINLD